MTTVTITGAVIIDGERHDTKVDIELPDDVADTLLRQDDDRR